MATEIEGFLPDDKFFVDIPEEDFDDDFFVDSDLIVDGFVEDDFFVDENGKRHHGHDHYHTPIRFGTSFQEVYDFFLAGITDDMFLELTPEDTKEILQELLLSALPYFEFARHDLFDMDLMNGHFNFELTVEEMMIIRQYMIAQWIGYQLATIDLIKQKYSGSDFKFTSQASHIKQLQTMKKEYETQGFHLQRLYKRRKRKADGSIGSTLSMIMEKPIP